MTGVGAEEKMVGQLKHMETPRLGMKKYLILKSWVFFFEAHFTLPNSSSCTWY